MRRAKAKVKADDPPVCAFGNTGEGWDGPDHCEDCHRQVTAVVEIQDGPPVSAETVPVADAMAQAAAEIAAAAPTDPESPVVTDVDGQGELFPPPPFDFEKAYDALHRLDLSAKSRKSSWEACKRDAKDAKDDYDAAIEALHRKFDEVDWARRHALRQVNTTAAMGVAFAAVVEQQNANAEGGGNEMSDETPATEPVPDATGTTEAPTPETPEPAKDDLPRSIVF